MVGLLLVLCSWYCDLGLEACIKGKAANILLIYLYVCLILRT